MARKRRALSPRMVYHICNRATEKVRLFSSDDDYELWIKTFREALDRYPLEVYGYCLMPNHWHLLLSCRESAMISRALKWLGATHAIRWRKRSESIGRGAVYQSRYRCHAVRANQIFLVVARYIERNPVRAGLCKQPKDWRWSSLGQSGKTIPITTWPMSKPVDWDLFMAHGGCELQEQQIRKALLTGQPFIG